MIRLGVGAGLAFSCLLSGIVGVPLARKLVERKRAGWNPVPVVVAAVDMKAGDAIVMEKISQRSVPEQFVTQSVVRPDSASYVINQPALVPLSAGDIITWPATQSPAAVAECSKLVEGLLTARPERPEAVRRVVAELRRRASAPPARR
jgi:pilus assembly protein CpaB